MKLKLLAEKLEKQAQKAQQSRNLPAPQQTLPAPQQTLPAPQTDPLNPAFASATDIVNVLKKFNLWNKDQEFANYISFIEPPKGADVTYKLNIDPQLNPVVEISLTDYNGWYNQVNRVITIRNEIQNKYGKQIKEALFKSKIKLAGPITLTWVRIPGGKVSSKDPLQP